MPFSQLTALMARMLGIFVNNHAFEAVEEIPEDDDDATCDDNLNENDNPYVDEDGNFFATEEHCVRH